MRSEAEAEAEAARLGFQGLGAPRPRSPLGSPAVAAAPGAHVAPAIPVVARAAAAVADGRAVKDGIRAMIVPGSGLIKQQAEEEGLDKVFIASGFEWREPGCSMCLAMNEDKLDAGERCASTSNRNFEGRQGRGGRTHLVSPEMAVAAAVSGHLCDVREL